MAFIPKRPYVRPSTTIQVRCSFKIKGFAKYPKNTYLENLKKFLVYITQVGTENPVETPKKKIKLQVKYPAKSIISFIKRLELSSSSNEKLQVLAEISDTLNIEDINFETVKFLSSLFTKEKDFVRVKIIYLLSDFVLNHGLDQSLILEEIMFLIKSEDSSKVINQAFISIFRIGQVS